MKFITLHWDALDVPVAPVAGVLVIGGYTLSTDDVINNWFPLELIALATGHGYHANDTNPLNKPNDGVNEYGTRSVMVPSNATLTLTGVGVTKEEFTFPDLAIGPSVGFIRVAASALVPGTGEAILLQVSPVTTNLAYATAARAGWSIPAGITVVGPDAALVDVISVGTASALETALNALSWVHAAEVVTDADDVIIAIQSYCQEDVKATFHTVATATTPTALKANAGLSLSTLGFVSRSDVMSGLLVPAVGASVSSSSSSGDMLVGALFGAGAVALMRN